MKSPNNKAYLDCFELDFWEDLKIMKCLMTEIENDFVYTIVNAYLGSNFSDNVITNVLWLEVITIKMKKKLWKAGY